MEYAIVDHVVENDGAGFECVIYRCKKHPDQTWPEYLPGCPLCEEEWAAENTCSLCHGSGSLPSQEDIEEQQGNGIGLKTTECPACEGTGYKLREE